MTNKSNLQMNHIAATKRKGWRGRGRGERSGSDDAEHRQVRGDVEGVYLTAEEHLLRLLPFHELGVRERREGKG